MHSCHRLQKCYVKNCTFPYFASKKQHTSVRIIKRHQDSKTSETLGFKTKSNIRIPKQVKNYDYKTSQILGYKAS